LRAGGRGVTVKGRNESGQNVVGRKKKSLGASKLKRKLLPIKDFWEVRRGGQSTIRNRWTKGGDVQFWKTTENPKKASKRPCWSHAANL